MMRLLALCLVVVAACGAGASDTPSSPDGGAAPAVVFPLRRAPSGPYLEDSAGTPFLIHGDSPWSLIVQLTREEATRYLDDRRARGVNTLLVNLIEHMFADDPPRNAYGAAPFTTAGNFATPNDAYFDHAVWVVREAAARGMVVLLAPAYLGYNGGPEGWFADMSKLSPAVCTGYGTYVANKLADARNVIWVHGGDYTPPVGSAGEACALAIAAAIRAALPGRLHTGHWSPETSSLDQPSFAASVDLVGVYTDGFTHARCLSARARAAGKPTFLFESEYENEHDVLTRDLRREAWGAVLSCGAGQLSGNRPIWLFADGWEAALGSPASRHMSHLAALLAPRRWHELTPDAAHQVVTAGFGTLDTAGYAVVAATADRRLALAYLPDEANRRPLTLDLAVLPDAVTARWYDPTSGAFTAIAGSPFAASGTVSLAPPAANAAGDDDWVLVLELPPRT